MSVAEILVGFGAQVAQEVRTNNPVADSYVRALARLMQHASRYAAVASSGIKCSTKFRNPIGEISDCDAAGIGPCVACGRPTCLGHSMISPIDGNIICFGCVAIAERAAKKTDQAPPAPASGSGPVCTCSNPWNTDKDCVLHGKRNDDGQRRKHLNTLGLSRHANWLQIQAAYRKLARENHPDRAHVSDRATAHHRMARINAAFEWLKERNQEAA